MAVPTFQDLFWPSLLALKDGRELTLNETFESSVKILQLTKGNIDSKMKVTGMGRARYRTNWAMTYLTKAGLAERVKRGTYRLTNGGKELVRKDLGKIDANYLKDNYPAFREWTEASRGSVEEKELQPTEGGTPPEAIEADLELINEELGQQLLDQIIAKDPSFFEFVVKSLLQAMDYGEGDVVGQSGDEGFSGFVPIHTLFDSCQIVPPVTQRATSQLGPSTLQRHLSPPIVPAYAGNLPL